MNIGSIYDHIYNMTINVIPPQLNKKPNYPCFHLIFGMKKKLKKKSKKKKSKKVFTFYPTYNTVVVYLFHYFKAFCPR